MGSTGTPNSAIFTGSIAHTRFAPRRRDFRYPVYMLYIDLAELDSLFAGSRLFSARRRAAARFCREDFYGDPARPLAAEIRDLVEQRTGERPVGPIRLLANMRTFGYQFNPIAVYYCFDAGGERLTHVVADVSNIPWRESCAYVFGADGHAVDGQAEKRMHVSPFLEMDYTYRLRTAAPDDELALFVTNSRDGDVEFAAALRLRRQPATNANLRRILARFPAMALTVTLRIFWQALKLKLSGHRWYPHAAPLPQGPVESIEQERERHAAIR
ncbi:MAG: DUF1365 domain-containing protein [Solirubrobacterales bacterium]